MYTSPLTYFSLDWVEMCPEHPGEPRDPLQHVFIQTVVA